MPPHSSAADKLNKLVIALTSASLAVGATLYLQERGKRAEAEAELEARRERAKQALAKAEAE